MTRINDDFLNSVVFIFPSRETAERGEMAGGTGFVIDHEIEGQPGVAVKYIVTNSHVVASGGHFIRLNTAAGPPCIVEAPPDLWTHGGVDDIAVISASVLSGVNGLTLQSIVWPSLALTESMIPDLHLGVGDEVVMLGRLVSLADSEAANVPVARSGIIAMMPKQITDGRGFSVQAFLIEMRSLSGFSGSPVICTIVPGAWRGIGLPQDFGTGYQFILGIDSGHIRLTSPLLDGSGSRSPDGSHIKEHSGMSIVVPAWRISSLLNEPELKAARIRAGAAFKSAT